MHKARMATAKRAMPDFRSSVRPEFDQFAKSYEELLNDPIRNRFLGTRSDFFHVRKRDLIRDYFAVRTSTSHLSYLDLGCGKGELASLLLDDFREVAGCDPSAQMLSHIKGFETRVQENPGVIPYSSENFDFVTAVCVYHHVTPDSRLDLTREVHRVLRPGGVFCIIEHNPWNPATRLIVSRTPVDSDAILLRSSETRNLMQRAGFSASDTRYFLYFPERIYSIGGFAERALARFPGGGQYAVFGQKPAGNV